MKNNNTNFLRLIFAAFVCLLIIPLGGCSTIEGFGKDLSSAASWTRSKFASSDNEEETSPQLMTAPGEFQGNRGY